MILAISRAIESLRLGRRGESLAQAVERRWGRGERHVDQARASTSACTGLRPSCDLSTPSCMPVQARRSPCREYVQLWYGTDDRAHMPGLLAAQLRAAVAAHVVERAHAALIVANHQHRRSVDGQRQEIAGFRNLELESGEQPAAVPDRTDLRGVQRVDVIERARHAVAFAARGEQRVELGAWRDSEIRHIRLRMALRRVRQGSHCDRDRTAAACDEARDAARP